MFTADAALYGHAMRRYCAMRLSPQPRALRCRAVPPSARLGRYRRAPAQSGMLPCWPRPAGAAANASARRRRVCRGEMTALMTRSCRTVEEGLALSRFRW